jgi:porin
VKFDFQYISDSLWNIKSEQKERLASWNRFRGTVDIDFSALIGKPGLYFHATALWQGGGNLGTYLGLLTGPSGLASGNTCRLDSWWIEKRWPNKRISARVGQFAGQDFYGAQHYAASFIFEPMGYAFGNLFTTLESFDPPSTPAMEVRVAPVHHFYVKSMVFAAVRSPFSQNPTGLVPQFNGTPGSVSEIGFTPGEKASSVRAFDTVDSRKGYYRPLPVRRFLQSRKVYVADEYDTTVGELPLVLDGEPGSLASGSARSKGSGRDVCVRLEPREHQPQQHVAYRGTSL